VRATESQSMSEKIILLFNGPPSSGKSEAARYVSTSFGAKEFNFKDKLIALTKEIYNISDEEWLKYYNREDKDTKVIPNADGKTARETLIFVSEGIIKPLFGKDYFGKCAVEAIRNSEKMIVCGDCGFDQEVLPVVNHFGKDNVFLVRIHRKGCSFVNDSRNWISKWLFNQENIFNVTNNMDNKFYDDINNIILKATRR